MRNPNLNTTDHDLLRQLNSDNTDERRAALEKIFGIYAEPLRVHVVRKFRIDWNAAEDIVSDFITDRIVQKQICSTYDADQGRFRSFLLTCLDRFTINKLQRRIGEEPYLDEPSQRVAVDSFQLSWARELLRQTIERMRLECRNSQREQEWKVFEERVLNCLEDDHQGKSHDELAIQLGLENRRQSENLLITGKRRFRRCLRAVVEEYSADADGEIRMLREVIDNGIPLHLQSEIQDLDLSSQHDPAAISIVAIDSSQWQSLIESSDSEQVRKLCSLYLDKHYHCDEGSLIPSETGGEPLQTLLLSPSEIVILQQIKRRFRNRARNGTSPETQAAKVIYLASIASALVHHNESISKFENEKLRKGINGMLDNNLVPAELQDLFQRAAAKVTDAN